MELLDGSDRSPPKTMEIEDSEGKKTKVSNPAYGIWITRDQQLVSYLVKAVSPEINADLLGLEHAAEMWAAIDAKFSAQMKARIGMLRASLANTKKRDLSATIYINKMKGFAYELASAGRIVNDDELKEYLLAGLHGEYNGLVATINAIPSTTSADVCNQLLAYDYRQKMLAEEESTTTFSSSVNSATRRGGSGGSSYRPNHGGSGYRHQSGGGHGGGNYGGGGHGGGGHRNNNQGRPPRRNDGYDGRRPPPKGGRNRGRGNRTPSPHQDVTCQICKKYGHPASECWWRYGDDEDDDSHHEEKGANVASYGVDTNWYMDSGATNHVAGQMSKLTTHEHYQGNDQIHNASGQGSGHKENHV